MAELHEEMQAEIERLRLQVNWNVERCDDLTTRLEEAEAEVERLRILLQLSYADHDAEHILADELAEAIKTYLWGGPDDYGDPQPVEVVLARWEEARRGSA